MTLALPAPKYPPGSSITFRHRKRAKRVMTGVVMRRLPERPWPLLVRVGAVTYVVEEERVAS